MITNYNNRHQYEHELHLFIAFKDHCAALLPFTNQSNH